MPSCVVTSRIAESRARSPPAAIVWYICAISKTLMSTAPSRLAAWGGSVRSTPSRLTLASTRSTPSPVPRPRRRRCRTSPGRPAAAPRHERSCRSCRLPVLRAGRLPDEGPVIDARCERIALRLGQRRQVDGGLEQRADRAPRVDGAVVAAIAGSRPPTSACHLAAVAVGDHDRPFEARIPRVVLREALGQRRLGGALRMRI